MCETAPRHHLSSQSLSILISPLLLVQHTRSSFPAITHHYSTRVEAWDSSPSFSLSLTPVCFSFPQCSAAISLSCAFSMTYHNYRATFPFSIFQLLFLFFFWYRQWCKRYKCFSLLLAEVSVSCLWRKVWLNRLLSTELNPVITVGLFALLKMFTTLVWGILMWKINSFWDKHSIIATSTSWYWKNEYLECTLIEQHLPNA